MSDDPSPHGWYRMDNAWVALVVPFDDRFKCACSVDTPRPMVRPQSHSGGHALRRVQKPLPSILRFLTASQ